MKKVRNSIYLLLVTFSFCLSTLACRKNASGQNEYIIDSLYVDYADNITFYIQNYQDTENCVRQVFQCFESSEHKSVNFVTNKKATRIEHNYMYIKDRKTNRFTFSKFDSIPNSINSFRLKILEKNYKPITLSPTTEKDTTYYTGDFEKMNFSILKSFHEAMIGNRYNSGFYHRCVLVNKSNEPKFEIIYRTEDKTEYKTYKIY